MNPIDRSQGAVTIMVINRDLFEPKKSPSIHSAIDQIVVIRPQITTRSQPNCKIDDDANSAKKTTENKFVTRNR